MTLDIALVPVAAVSGISLALALLVWLLATRRRTSPRVLANLGRGRYGVQLQRKERGGLDPRLLALAYRLSPDCRVRALNGLWTRAGRPDAWSMDRLLVAKLLLPAVAAVLGLLFFVARPGLLALLLTVVAIGVCYFLPELLLHSRGQERSQQIALELADTLDQMTIAVEAGLGFDSAMIKAGRNGRGPSRRSSSGPCRTSRSATRAGTRTRRWRPARAWRTCAGSSAPSSRQTATASLSPTCSARRRRRCASSGGSGRRRRPCRSR